MIGSFDKVLVVLNTLQNIDVVLKKALKIVSDLESILEILYVHESSLFSLEDNSIDRDKIKKEIKSLVPDECAIFVYEDDTVDRVINLVNTQEDLLIVTAYEESITAKLIDQVSKSFLVIKNERILARDTIMIVDLNNHIVECINLVKELFKGSDIKLLYDNTSIISKELQVQECKKYETIKKEVGLNGYYLSEHFTNEVEFVNELYSVEKNISKFIDSKNFDLSIFCLDSFDKTFLSLIKTDILVFIRR
jgi:hypothetical protein